MEFSRVPCCTILVYGDFLWLDRKKEARESLGKARGRAESFVSKMISVQTKKIHVCLSLGEQKRGTIKYATCR